MGVESLVGTTIGGYKLTEMIGSGSTGQLYVAEDSVGSRVGIKVLHPALSLFTRVQSFWDELQKITDKPIRKCPECGARRAKKMISQTNFVLKGSGWYVTDYGKGTGGQAGERKSKPKKTESDTSSKATKSDKSSKKKD